MTKPLAARLRRVTCHAGCRPAERLEEGRGEPTEGLVLLRLAQRRDEQLRVSWRVHGMPSVQIARWFSPGGGEWLPLSSQVSVKLYELLPLRSMLRRAHLRRRPGEVGRVLEERVLGRGTGRRSVSVSWTETGIKLALGSHAVEIDRASLCHVFDALDVAIVLGREIPGSALAKIGAGWDDDGHERDVVARARAKRPPAQMSRDRLNETPLNETPLKERAKARVAAPPAPRREQASLFGEEPEKKPRKPGGGGPGKLVAAFYRALDEAEVPHAAPVWARDGAQAKRLVAQIAGVMRQPGLAEAFEGSTPEQIAHELIPLALDDPWFSGLTLPNFGCFLRIGVSLMEPLVEQRAEAAAARREAARAAGAERRLADHFLKTTGNRHPADQRPWPELWDRYRELTGRRHRDDDRE